MKRKKARKDRWARGEFGGVLDEDGGTIGRADDGDRSSKIGYADAQPPRARRRTTKKSARA